MAVVAWMDKDQILKSLVSALTLVMYSYVHLKKFFIHSHHLHRGAQGWLKMYKAKTGKILTFSLWFKIEFDITFFSVNSWREHF